MSRGPLVAVAALATLVTWMPSASAQSLSLRIEGQQIYEDLPFVLAVAAEGFDESPEPEPPEISIDGARITYLGVSPNIKQSMRVINGRTSMSRQVSFVYRYRIEVPDPGKYTVQPITVEQGQKGARTGEQTFNARPIDTTQDMGIEIHLPDRPLWVGETAEVGIDWYLRRDPGDQSFVIPLFDSEDFQALEPPARGSKTLEFAAGAKDLALPYSSENVVKDGVQYTRFRFRALIQPKKPGSFSLDPPRVVAKLEAGVGRDAFGFRSRRFSLFKAEGSPVDIEVRPLPAQGRPAGFSGAVGAGFSLDVQASRTVVSVGEPIELSITVKSETPLEGFRLPDLHEAGLPEAFDVPEEELTGELLDTGGGKLFRATVRLMSADVREIPALALGYFDPGAGSYQTAKSQPIALSVSGAAIVSASDVVGAGGDEGAAELAAGRTGTGADLSLSASGETLRRARSIGGVLPLLIVLYALPILIFVGRRVQLATRGERARAGAQKRALRDALRVVDSARSEPARESGARLIAALKALARETGGSLDQELTARIENESYKPSSADSPLASAILDDAAREAEALASNRSRRPGPAAGAAMILFALQLPGQAHAASLDEARATYRGALAQDDVSIRAREFARAEAQLRALALQKRDRPELQADWGNAALGAGDTGHAVLAYRRALVLEPGHERARRNLEWVRDRLPDWAAERGEAGAVDSLLFWHHRLSQATRHLYAAFAFAIAALLCVPWSRRRQRLLRRLAIVPGIVFVALLGSALLGSEPTRDAVVLSGGTQLRSADSHGAPQVALPGPLPAGAEVELLEVRDAWVRVRLAGGTDGWLPSDAVSLVVRPAPVREETK